MKIKRIQGLTSIVLCFLFLLSQIPVYASDRYATRGETADMLVSAAAYYNPGIQKTDVIKGYEDGTLHEEQTVTRAEALVMLKRAFGTLPELQGHNARVAIPQEAFNDVPDWAQTELASVFAAGLAEGTQTGVFSPNEIVTKDQMQLFIKRAFAIYGTNLKDDFYATVNKDILNKLEIKPGHVVAGTLYDLQDVSNDQVSAIIDEIKSGTNEKGTAMQKVADFYNNILDKKARNEVGITPIQSYLAKIDAVSTFQELESVKADLEKNLYISPFIGFSLSLDLKDSTKYMLSFYTMSASLTKDFYAAGEGAQKTAYIQYLKTLLTLGGETEQSAQSKAETYFNLEKTLSESMMDPQEYGDVDKIYNLYTIDQIQQMFPETDINAILSLSGLKAEDKVLIQDTALAEKFSELYCEKNLDALKAAAKIDVLMGYGGALNDEFVKASETFNQEFLGMEGAYTDEERAALTVQSIMADYIGEIYSEKYFDEESKNNVEKMVRDIISVYKNRIAKLDWMSETTKEKALKKLDTMVLKIGYPDKWETYLDNADIKSAKDGGSYFQNILDIGKAQIAYLSTLQGTTVDRTKWAMYPFTVNACYSATSNDITFPAAILQPPMYDKNASYEHNLGGIGYIIAHEITHAFDNNGAKFDENGNAANWWTDADYDAFRKLCEKAIYFYDKQEGLPGIPMNGELTLSENVADLGAASCITEIVSGLENPDFKALYTSMANSWASTESREYASYAAQADVHSADKLRVNRVLENFEEFYKVFDIKEGDGMYVPLAERVKIW